MMVTAFEVCGNPPTGGITFGLLAPNHVLRNLAPSGREVSNTGIILVGFVGDLASANRVGCDLKAIPTQLHAAPASRPLLADVMEMQHALGTLADALAIHSRE